MICNMCIKRTDKDSQYLETEEYKASISRKNNDHNILIIGNHTYLFRKDTLYTGTNPNAKSEITNNNNKKKLVSLCYFLASINNKYINGIKVNIGS